MYWWFNRSVALIELVNFCVLGIKSIVKVDNMPIRVCMNLYGFQSLDKCLIFVG